MNIPTFKEFMSRPNVSPSDILEVTIQEKLARIDRLDKIIINSGLSGLDRLVRLRDKCVVELQLFRELRQ